MKRSKHTIKSLDLIKNGQIKCNLITNKNRLFFKEEIRKNNLRDYSINILSTLSDEDIKEIISNIVYKMNFKNIYGFESIYLIKNNKILNYELNTEELLFLRKKQKEGAIDFKIIIKSGLSENKKRLVIKNYIKNYEKIKSTSIQIKNL
jgi:hypothetical protein